MARATSSFPVPVSPSKSTVESPQATVSTSRRAWRRPELLPMIPSKPLSGFTASSIPSISSVISRSVLDLGSSYCAGQVRLFKPIATLPFLQLVRVSVLFFPARPSTFSPNPFPDVRRTILEFDAARFAIRKKLDGIAVYQRYVFQIQRDVAAGPFQLEEPAQLIDIPCFDSTA